MAAAADAATNIICVWLVGHWEGAHTADRYEAGGRGCHAAAGERRSRQTRACCIAPQTTWGCEEHKHWHEQSTSGMQRVELLQPVLSFYLCQGGYDYTQHLFVCLFVSLITTSHKTSDQILLQTYLGTKKQGCGLCLEMVLRTIKVSSWMDWRKHQSRNRGSRSWYRSWAVRPCAPPC